MSRFPITLRLAVIGTIAGLALAACSSTAAAPASTPSALPSAAAPSAAPSMAPSAAPSTDPSPAGSAGASAATGETYTLDIATDPKVGKYLTGEDGKTLYTFMPDSANTSTCDGGCATVWPPLTVEADDIVMGGTGVTGKIATFKRNDGTLQVSYNGKPLYYFASDTKAGDVTGDGVEKFYVATP